jgi:hypothetical protein
MASNRQSGGQQGGQSGRGFASMDDEEQRRIAQKGGEASARQQDRDAQGQFTGSGGGQGSKQGSSRSGGSNQGGSSSNRNQGSKQGQGGDNR